LVSWQTWMEGLIRDHLVPGLAEAGGQHQQHLP
jgi:hypothetical protein